MPEIAFDPLDPTQRSDPFPVYAEARREAPVFYAPAFDLWVVTRYDDVLAMLKDHEAFSSRNALRSSPREPLPEVREVLAQGWPRMPIIVDSDPPLHGRIRRPITKAFTPRRVSKALDRLLSSERILAACREWQQRIRAEDPVKHACDLLEETYDRHKRG